MFILISNEPIKVADLQKLANQLMLNGALVIDLPVKARKTLVVWYSKKHSNQNQIRYLRAVKDTRFH